MRSTIHRATGRRVAALGTALIVLLATFAVALWTPAYSQLPDTSAPELKLNRTIRTAPFAGSSVSTLDNEGSAYVPSDNSLWLADDNSRRIYEVNASTGELRRSIDRDDFAAVGQFRGGPLAGAERNRDMESLAYDAVADVLYVFSGLRPSLTALPTVFRLTRQSGDLRLDSYQPLSSTSDFTAAAWNPGDNKLYVANSTDYRSYNYDTNKLGSTSTVPGLTGILGMTFSADGADLFVARTSATLTRVNWATKSLVSGWTLDLKPFGMLDTRAVELVNDQFYVSDGYDFRTTTDPLRHAVFVFDVLGSTPTPTPTATSWTATVATAGYPTRLRATLSNADTGGALGNQAVGAQVKWYGSNTWRSVGTGLSTSGSGVVTFWHNTKRAGHFRFSLAQSSDYRASVSTAVFVKVPTKLSATVTKGHPDIVRGRLSTGAGSPLKGETVSLQRRHAGHRRWVTVATPTTNRYGKVVSRQRPRREVYYRWTYSGSATNRLAVSKRIAVRL